MSAIATQYLNSLPSTVQSISLRGMDLEEFPDLSRFTHLRTLDCSYNKFRQLPMVKGIVLLNCSYNKLEKFPELDITVEVLKCDSNKIKFIPSLAQYPNLHTIECNFNGLTQLPGLSKSGVKKLFCMNNYIPELPDDIAYSQLEELNISSNCIYIRELPPTLTVLTADFSELYELPDLPPRLVKLRCRGNSLEYLPNLPSTLVELDCSSNELYQLPSLPPSLRRLRCTQNELEELPAMPSGMTELICEYNPLYCFPDIGHNILTFSCEDTPLYDYINTGHNAVENIRKINNVKNMLMAAKYRKKFMQWMLRSQESRIQDKYSPEKLHAILARIGETDDEEVFQAALENWINE